MTAQTVTGAVATRDNGPGALIARYQQDFAAVLPTHIKPETFVRLAQGVLRRNAKVAKVAKANPGSFLAALLDCARLGHEPDTPAYYLVPFGSEIQGIEGYQGEIERMFRAGAVASVKAEVVKAGDLARDEQGRPRFEWIPSEMDRPHHKPDLFADRGELIGTYAYAEMVDGSTSRVVFMNKAEVMKHKAMSKSANSPDSPWQRWEDGMWLKTGVHELEKWVPTSSEYRREQLRAAAEASVAAAASAAPITPAAPAESPADILDAEVVTEEPTAEPQEPTATKTELTQLHTLLTKCGVTKPDDRKKVTARLVGRALKSTSELSSEEADTLIELLGRAAADTDPAKALDAVLAEFELADEQAGDGA